MARAIGVVVALGVALLVALLGDGSGTTPLADIGGEVSAVAPDAPSAGVVENVAWSGGPSPPASSTTSPRPDPDARRVELERAARAAYLVWFDSIYRDDPDALAAAVGTAEMHDAGIRAMDEDRIAFITAPTTDNVVLVVDEVLRDSHDCVVAVVTDDLSGFIDAKRASRTVIAVYWPDPGTGDLAMATQWEDGTPESVWRTDCDQRLRGREQ